MFSEHTKVRQRAEGGIVTTQERIFRSQDGRLYLVSGSNNVSALYSADGFAEMIDCDAWRLRFVERSRFASSIGAKFCQLIVPEKLSLGTLRPEESMQVFGREPGSDLLPPGRRLLEVAPQSSVIYPAAYLRDQAAQFTIFPATDSHWSWVGAFSAFQLMMGNLQYQVDYRSFVDLPRFALTYRGDLWEAPHEDISAEAFERVRLPASIRRIYCNPLLGLKEQQGVENEAGLHVGSHCVFVNDAAELDETVILFGSSFSECRLEPSLLTAIFAYYFRTVHFIWSTSFDLDYIARHRPNLVIAEMPERFLTSCPDDTLEIEIMAAEQVARWRAKHVESSRAKTYAQ